MRRSRIVGHSQFGRVLHGGRCSQGAGHRQRRPPPARRADDESLPRRAHRRRRRVHRPAPPVPPPVPAGWKTFTTSDGTLAFDYPETWTIKDPAGPPAEGGVLVDLVSDYGKTMATLRTGMVTGAECTEKLPFMVYDTEPVPALAQDGATPRFVYEGRTDPASSDPSKAPHLRPTASPPRRNPSGTTACPISHFFTWPPSGAIVRRRLRPVRHHPGSSQERGHPRGVHGHHRVQRRQAGDHVTAAGRKVGPGGHGFGRRPPPLEWPCCSAAAAPPGTGPAADVLRPVRRRTADGAPAQPDSRAAPQHRRTTTPSDRTPAEGTPSSGWKTFTTTDAGCPSTIPPDWTVKDPGGALGGEFVDVLNAEGKPMASLRTNIVTGAECVGKYPVPGLRFRADAGARRGRGRATAACPATCSNPAATTPGRWPHSPPSRRTASPWCPKSPATWRARCSTCSCGRRAARSSAARTTRRTTRRPATPHCRIWRRPSCTRPPRSTRRSGR